MPLNGQANYWREIMRLEVQIQFEVEIIERVRSLFVMNWATCTGNINKRSISGIPCQRVGVDCDSTASHNNSVGFCSKGALCNISRIY